jgi:glycosyltransferase involved in cell wall biosynthesis
MTNGQRKDPVSQKAVKKSLRVALIASEHTVRDYSTFLQHLLVGLADESIPAALVCPPQFDPASVFTGAAEVISHPAFNLPMMGGINIRLLAERLAKFEPTVIHCLCESKASLTSQLAYRLDLPYALMVNSLQKWWKRLSISSQYCARIVVPAKSLAENMTSFHPGFADRIRQINIGTFVARSVGCFSDPSRLVTMVMAGPSKKAEDIEILLGVTRHLMIDGYEFVVVIAVEERAQTQTWRLLDALGLLKAVTIVPRQMPLRPVLAAADIFIQPQPNYAFNPVLLEAMSVGAAVAGCTGGVDELIIEDRTAVVFDPNDEMSIMRALKRLLDRREFARQMAANAQQHLKENYSVGKMIAATLEMYYEMQG